MTEAGKFFFAADVLIGVVAAASFVVAYLARLDSDGDKWQKYMKIFAVSVGLIAILFVLAAVFDIEFLPKK